MPTQEKWQSASLQKVPRTNGITLTQTGKAVTGLQKIDKATLYFDQDGKQVKGKNRDTFR